MAKLDAVMNTPPRGLYERFRRGLLEYHSEVRTPYALLQPPLTFLSTSESISRRVASASVYRSSNRTSQRSGGVLSV